MGPPSTGIGGRLVEGERAVADDAILVAGGVAGIAQIYQLGLQPAPARQLIEAGHWRCAARLLVGDVGCEAEDRLRRRAVQRLRVVVGKVMGQVGAHDDQRLGPAPQGIEDIGDFLGAGPADRERHQRKALDHRLQERHVDFQRVLVRVGLRADDDLRQGAQGLDRGLVDLDRADGRGERAASRQRQAAHRHAMRRAEQHDARDAPARRRE
jgi:hypothetical protein